jgi:hypothetical protein
LFDGEGYPRRFFNNSLTGARPTVEAAGGGDGGLLSPPSRTSRNERVEELPPEEGLASVHLCSLPRPLEDEGWAGRDKEGRETGAVVKGREAEEVAMEVVARPWDGTSEWLEGGLASGAGEGAGAERDIVFF